MAARGELVHYKPTRTVANTSCILAFKSCIGYLQKQVVKAACIVFVGLALCHYVPVFVIGICKQTDCDGDGGGERYKEV